MKKKEDVQVMIKYSSPQPVTFYTNKRSVDACIIEVTKQIKFINRAIYLQREQRIYNHRLSRARRGLLKMFLALCV
ncbi:hypothetical protein Mgra_00007813 [Meloidogyne graminicola]|uniref:Uncharacterized protein n=1 Tax=Meloidogyne graminicola TaxID=189291 RepID=A0A8S9ZHL1_9BILA|nr:hypothetical protein Mgra_00007813 [Meloidogyne graminicola]